MNQLSSSILALDVVDLNYNLRNQGEKEKQEEQLSSVIDHDSDDNEMAGLELSGIPLKKLRKITNEEEVDKDKTSVDEQSTRTLNGLEAEVLQQMGSRDLRMQQNLWKNVPRHPRRTFFPDHPDVQTARDKILFPASSFSSTTSKIMNHFIKRRSSSFCSCWYNLVSHLLILF